MSRNERRSSAASKRAKVIQFANNLLTVVSSVLTIGIVILGVWDWSRQVEVTIEINQAPQRLPNVTPTTRAIPTYTPTPIITPTRVLAPTSTPTVIPEQVHTVRPKEILACLAKFYYNSPDAHDELCAFNVGHPGSDLYGEESCSVLFPGEELIIPGTLRVTDVRLGKIEDDILLASVTPAPANGYLCQ